MEHVSVRREFVARALVTACPIGSSDAYEVMQGAHSNGFSLVGIFGQEVLPLDFTLLFHHFINSVLPLWKQETRAFEKGFLGDVLAQSVFRNWHPWEACFNGCQNIADFEFFSWLIENLIRLLGAFDPSSDSPSDYFSKLPFFIKIAKPCAFRSLSSATRASKAGVWHCVGVDLWWTTQND